MAVRGFPCLALPHCLCSGSLAGSANLWHILQCHVCSGSMAGSSTLACLNTPVPVRPIPWPWSQITFRGPYVWQCCTSLAFGVWQYCTSLAFGVLQQTDVMGLAWRHRPGLLQPWRLLPRTRSVVLSTHVYRYCRCNTSARTIAAKPCVDACYDRTCKRSSTLEQSQSRCPYTAATHPPPQSCLACHWC